MKKYIFSLTTKIVIISLTSSLCITLVASMFLYTNIYRSIYKENIEQISHNLEIIMANIDKDLQQIQNMVTWASVNYSIYLFLNTDSGQEASEPLSVIAYNALTYQLFITSISSYVYKVILNTYKGRSLNTGFYQGVMQEADRISEAPYFDTLLNFNGYSWIGLVETKFFNFSGDDVKTVIPIVRPLIHMNSGQTYGWIYIALSADIIIDRIEERKEFKDTNFILKIGDEYYQITSLGFTRVTPAMEQKNIFQSQDAQKGTVFLNGKLLEVVGIKALKADWELMQIIPHVDGLRVNIMEIIPPLLVLFFLFSILSYNMINRIIALPIKRVIHRIQMVSTGDFSNDPKIEGSDEIGSIGRSINKMSNSIVALMEERIQIEREKRDLELINLQERINPHFIYNTLNIIKWMAIIQQASGIVSVVDTIVAMLREIATDSRIHVPLKDEVRFLDSYINLIKFQYGKTFNYQVSYDERDLEEVPILKFTLQPIVENAIFHGLEPQERSGEISIYIGRQDGDLLITVFDNGVGIPQKQIERLLPTNFCAAETGSRHSTAGNILKGMGLNNINQRIKLEYGSYYGLHIDSVLGEYTRVSILYPCPAINEV